MSESKHACVYLDNVKDWSPEISYWTFQIKSDAADKFAAVNSRVELCCNNIDGIISSLNTLKKMGENDDMNYQIDSTCKELQTKKRGVNRKK